MKYFKQILFSSVTLASMALSSALWAEIKMVDRVVAVVNNDVITQQELDKRFQFILRQNKFNLPKNQQRTLYRKVLNDLVNENIQKQFAARSNITVSKGELEMAIADMERRNNLSRGGFYNLSSGIEDTAKAKVQADLIWQKIVQRHVRPRIVVSPNEVDRMIESLIQSADISERELQHIFIPADDTNESKFKEILGIYNQLQDDPTLFDALAKSYGDGNGYLGWFAAGELAPTLEKAFKGLKVGEFGKPVQSSMGWHIPKVLNKRDGKKFETEPFKEYKFHVLSIESPTENQREDLLEALNDFETLGDMEEFILKNELKMDLSESGEKTWMREDKFPTWLLAEKLEEGKFTSSIETGKGVLIYYVDEIREQLPEKLRVYRKRMTERLVSNRTNLTARRFLRDLRRSAFVDIRI